MISRSSIRIRPPSNFLVAIALLICSSAANAAELKFDFSTGETQPGFTRMKADGDAVRLRRRGAAGGRRGKGAGD
jgi:hypothetical protein